MGVQTYGYGCKVMIKKLNTQFLQLIFSICYIFVHYFINLLVRVCMFCSFCKKQAMMCPCCWHAIAFYMACRGQESVNTWLYFLNQRAYKENRLRGYSLTCLRFSARSRPISSLCRGLRKRSSSVFATEGDSC